MTDETVIPIQIPTPFAVGDVCCYLIKDEITVLIDCGPKTPEAYERVQSALRSHSLDIAQLDEIWLTHGHPDHFGQASVLAAESGARVRGHAKDRACFTGHANEALFEHLFRSEGIPNAYIEQMVTQLEWLQQFQDALCPDWMEEGEELATGRQAFTVRLTPGHSPGHLTFVSADGQNVFSGDVLLQHISTNALIHFDPDTAERNKSLLQYRTSLQWIRTLGGRVLPGHGQQIANITEVADRHLSEHRKRYDEILRLLRQADRGYMLFELTETLFPEAVHNGAVFLALSEVFGYLDWGVREGAIVREEAPQGPRYRLPA